MKKYSLPYGAATLALVLLALTGLSLAQAPQPHEPRAPRDLLGTAFAYQGYLWEGDGPAEGVYDLRFELYDGLSGGTQIGSTLLQDSVTITSGLLMVELDFGAAAFNGHARYLEVSLRPSDSVYTYTVLAPRQPLLAVPYALALPGLWTQQNATSPNLIGGYSYNSVADGVVGATIGGGGSASSAYRDGRQEVNGNYGTVSGGSGNAVQAIYATIGGGRGNIADGEYATIAGGRYHDASGQAASIGGGDGNEALGDYDTVGGGLNNITGGDGTHATVGGGQDNQAQANHASIGGGQSNLAGGDWAAVGGGRDNEVTAGYGTIAGGGPSDPSSYPATNNRVTAGYGTVGGGGNNQVEAGYATIAGGGCNTASGFAATVGGGGGYYEGGTDIWLEISNQASGKWATISGGGLNVASGQAATVGGGGGAFYENIDGHWIIYGNEATGYHSTVGGGGLNAASNTNATVSGGYVNIASGLSATVGGGHMNTSSGVCSVVPGGCDNAALADYSFAAGRGAVADKQGCFIWGDATDAAISCDSENQFVVRSSGGTYFFTDDSSASGTRLPAGSSSWSQVSDRNLKQGFASVDVREVLARLAQIPISTWRYKAQDGDVRHMGPMAQDFYAAFGLGEDDRHIDVVDADGVALAAIQGLFELSQAQAARLQALETESAALRADLTALQHQAADLEARLASLEQQPGAARVQSLAGAGPAWLLPALALLAAGFALGQRYMRRAGGAR